MNNHIFLTALIALIFSFETINSMELPAQNPKSAPCSLNELGKKLASGKSYKQIELNTDEALKVEKELKQAFFTPISAKIYPISLESGQKARLYACTGCPKEHILLGNPEIQSCTEAIKSFTVDNIYKHVPTNTPTACFSPSGEKVAYLSNISNKKAQEKLFLAWRTAASKWTRNSFEIVLDSNYYKPEKAKMAFVDEDTLAVAFQTNRTFFNIYSLKNKKAFAIAEIGLGEKANPNLFEVMSKDTIWCGTDNAQIEVYKKNTLGNWSKESTYTQPDFSNESALSVPSKIATILEINPNGTVVGFEKISPNEQQPFFNVVTWNPEKNKMGFQTAVHQLFKAIISPEGNRVAILHSTEKEPQIMRVVVMDYDGKRCFPVLKASAANATALFWHDHTDKLFLKNLSGGSHGIINIPYAALGLTAIKKVSEKSEISDAN